MAAQNSGLKRAGGVGAAQEVQGKGPDAVEDQRSQLSRGRESQVPGGGAAGRRAAGHVFCRWGSPTSSSAV